MTVRDVADYFRVRRITIYRLIDAGKLHPFKIGRVWRFYRTDVMAAARAQGRKSN